MGAVVTVCCQGREEREGKQMERQEVRAGTETGPECMEGESSRRWRDSQELEGLEGGMGKARWCRVERGQSMRVRGGKRRCMVRAGGLGIVPSSFRRELQVVRED